jgi:hypothetical protein
MDLGFFIFFILLWREFLIAISSARKAHIIAIILINITSLVFSRHLSRHPNFISPTAKTTRTKIHGGDMTRP